MTPAGDKIIQCPHCGEKKQLLQIGSGNTFGSTLWSDTKMDCPMLPQHSQVQRCPKCGHYYFAYKSGVGENELWDVNTWKEGWLPLGYLKEALQELFPKYPQRKSFVGSMFSGKKSNEEKEQIVLRQYILWAFNDKYGNCQKEEIPGDEWELFVKNCEALIILGVGDQFEAELYREICDFDKALEVIDKFEEDERSEGDFKSKFVERAKNRDRRVFIVFGDAKRRELTLEKYLNSDDQ